MLPALKEWAKRSGFLAIGFSRPERPVFYDRFCSWLRDGKNADMSWLERHVDLREDPTKLLKGCRTIISLAYPYPPRKPATIDGYCVSRYSQPGREDYHQRLKVLCRELAGILGEVYPGSRSRICVDSAPLMEKNFASSSGIGFMGKNTMLIIQEYGSYFYLAEILTTAPIEFGPAEPRSNQCGSCTLCISSCPTGALEAPYYLDASKCLSYLTIEYKGEVGLEIGGKMGDCFFGCDRCQEVCPFNGEQTSREISLPSTEDFLEMKDEDFKGRFGKSAFTRAGLDKIKKNIRILRG